MVSAIQELTKDNTRGNIPALDGLRGIAVILVIIVHSNLYFGGPFLPGWTGLVSRFLGCSWVGVDLFFCLSGFLITGILIEAREDRHYFRNFYARRALRILPLYFTFLAAVLLSARLGLLQKVSSATANALLFYYYNFYVAYGGTIDPYSHQFWSLAVEEHFYLIWPWVVLTLSNRTLMRVCIVGAAVSFLLRIAVVASGQWVQVAYLTTPCRLDGLLLGSAVAIARRNTGAWDFFRKHAKTTLTSGLALAFGVGLGSRHFVDFVDLSRMQGPPTDSSVILTVGIAALSIAFSSVLVIVVDGGGPHLLRSRFLRSVGKYSYAMYIFHFILISALMDVVTRYGLESRNPIMGKLLLSAATLAVSYGCGLLSFHLFERHFLNLKRRFSYCPRSDVFCR